MTVFNSELALCSSRACKLCARRRSFRKRVAEALMVEGMVAMGTDNNLLDSYSL